MHSTTSSPPPHTTLYFKPLLSLLQLSKYPVELNDPSSPSLPTEIVMPACSIGQILGSLRDYLIRRKNAVPMIVPFFICCSSSRLHYSHHKKQQCLREATAHTTELNKVDLRLRRSQPLPTRQQPSLSF